MLRPIAVPEPGAVPRSVSAGLAALAGHAALIAAAVYATAAATPPGDTRLDVPRIVHVTPDSPHPAPDVAPSLALPPVPVASTDIPFAIPDGLPPIDPGSGFEVSGGGVRTQGDGGAGADTFEQPVLSYALVEEPPEPLTGPPLEYPPLLRRAGVEGRVVVEAVIDTAGRAEPGALRVVHSSHSSFDAAAVRYVRYALYRPGRVGGRAVRVLIRQPIEFRLRQE